MLERSLNYQKLWWPIQCATSNVTAPLCNKKKNSYFGLLSPFVQFPDLFPNVDAELVSKSGSQARPDIVLSWYAAGRRRTKSGGLWSNGTNEDLGWSGLSKKEQKKIITATSVYRSFLSRLQTSLDVLQGTIMLRSTKNTKRIRYLTYQTYNVKTD